MHSDEHSSIQDFTLTLTILFLAFLDRKSTCLHILSSCFLTHQHMNWVYTHLHPFYTRIGHSIVDAFTRGLGTHLPLGCELARAILDLAGKHRYLSRAFGALPRTPRSARHPAKPFTAKLIPQAQASEPTSKQMCKLTSKERKSNSLTMNV